MCGKGERCVSDLYRGGGDVRLVCTGQGGEGRQGGKHRAGVVKVAREHAALRLLTAPERVRIGLQLVEHEERAARAAQLLHGRGGFQVT